MKKLLVISHVWPSRGSSGQEQRVKNSLLALRNSFHITFLTFRSLDADRESENQLRNYCDELICLPSKYDRNALAKYFYKFVGTIRSYATALKFSNFVIGELELTPERIQPILNDSKFDCVLFEYWHAHRCISFFREKNIPCVLDMHNVLSESYKMQQEHFRFGPKIWKDYQRGRYAAIEEKVWSEFDAVVAINEKEHRQVKDTVPKTIKLFYTPMGVDLSAWAFGWNPDAVNPGIAYYGGLATKHNQQSALDCYRKIMPRVWQEFPNAKFWIIGSDPPDFIKEIPNNDPRVVVTGYVENVNSLLQSMSVAVCPWRGTYGFRSRLVELMALGVPLVSTPDAVYGMKLEDGKGISIGETFDELTNKTLSILADRQYAASQGKVGRLKVEELFSFQNTYERFSDELELWLDSLSLTPHPQVPTGNFGGARSSLSQ